MLIDEIKKANVQAMKDRDANKRAIFSVLITKYNNFAIEQKAACKEVTDTDLLNIIHKTVKELEDEAKSYLQAGREDRASEIAQQMVYISMYLPKQLTEAEIKEIIDTLEDKSIPSVMKHFKANYAGSVDMSLVDKVARSI